MVHFVAAQDAVVVSNLNFLIFASDFILLSELKGLYACEFLLNIVNGIENEPPALLIEVLAVVAPRQGKHHQVVQEFAHGRHQLGRGVDPPENLGELRDVKVIEAQEGALVDEVLHVLGDAVFVLHLDEGLEVGFEHLWVLHVLLSQDRQNL